MSPSRSLTERQPQVGAQRPAPIILVEQAALLKLGYDEANEIFVSSGNVCRGNNEAVAGALDKPLFEPIGNLFRAAHHRVMHPTAARLLQARSA